VFLAFSLLLIFLGIRELRESRKAVKTRVATSRKEEKLRKTSGTKLAGAVFDVTEALNDFHIPILTMYFQFSGR